MKGPGRKKHLGLLKVLMCPWSHKHFALWQGSVGAKLYSGISLLQILPWKNASHQVSAIF